MVGFIARRPGAVGEPPAARVPREHRELRVSVVVEETSVPYESGDPVFVSFGLPNHASAITLLATVRQRRTGSARCRGHVTLVAHGRKAGPHGEAHRPGRLRGVPGGMPIPTPIYRIIHIDSLDTLLRRDAIHAPSCYPDDGLSYAGIHAVQTQVDRASKSVPCGPGGAIRDYVGFYFGTRSPMLFRVHTGYNVDRVDQASIVYLVSTAQAVADARLGFVFTDRHSLATVAAFYSRLDQLVDLDFAAVNARQWNDTPAHPDRQEKKQAEFLVHGSMPWTLIGQLGVLNADSRRKVEAILDGRPTASRPVVEIQRSWYY